METTVSHFSWLLRILLGPEDGSKCRLLFLPCFTCDSYLHLPVGIIWLRNKNRFFLIIPVYLQSVQVHTVNWLKEVDECLGEGRSLALFYSVL
jgi:hypothetical protein